MAVQLAGAARSKLRSSRMRRRLFIALFVVVILIIVLLVAHKYMTPKSSPTAPGSAVQPLSFTAKQTTDINLVAGAVGQYAAANGVLPAYLSVASNGSLVLCGSVCNPTLYGVGGFSAYQASNIKLMNYSPGLTPSNQNMMYLVPGAKCGSDGKAGDPNPTPRSMVILYASVSSTGVATPRCVVL
jgi:hypothetical protein